MLGLLAAAWAGLGGPVLADDAAANRLFVEAVQLVDEAEGIEAPFERAGAYEKALAKLDAIVERHPESEFAVKLASGQAIGEVERSEIETAWQRALTEHCVAEPSRECLEERVLAASRIPEEPFDRGDILRLVATGYAELGDYDEAFEIAQSIEDLLQRAPAFRTIVTFQARLGDLAGALETARKIKRERERDGALAMIAGIQSELEGVDEALGTAAAIESPLHRITALILIAKTQHGEGDDKGIEEMLALALETARSMDDGREKAAAYGIVAALEVELGTPVGAEEAIKAIEDARAQEFAWQVMESVRERREVDVFGFWLGN